MKNNTILVYKDLQIKKGENALILSYKGETKKIKVKPDDDFVFKIQKTHVKAIGGVDGLYNYYQKCIETDFCTNYINNLLYYFNERTV